MKACGIPGRVGEWKWGTGNPGMGWRVHTLTRHERGTSRLLEFLCISMESRRKKGNNGRWEGRRGGSRRVGREDGRESRRGPEEERGKIQDSHLAAKTKQHTPSHLLTLPSSTPGDLVVVQRMVLGMVD